MMESLSQSEVRDLLRGEPVPQKRKPKTVTIMECAFEGCDKPQFNMNHRYCEAHLAQLKRKGVMRPLRSKRWTAAEEQRIREWYLSKGKGKAELHLLAAELRRTKQIICRKARELGLTDARRRWREPDRKYATIEEARAAIGRATKERIAKKGHPRGMLGKKNPSPFVMPRVDRKCHQCGCDFRVIETSQRKYCSRACAYASKDRIVERPKDRGTRICPHCKKEWKVTTRRAAANHCSHECVLESIRASKKYVTRACLCCGTEFTVHCTSSRRNCSRKCASQRQSSASKDRWRNEDYKQRMSDMITARHAANPPATPQFSNRKFGRRPDLGNQFFRSAWEANYARYLNWLIAQKQIVGWRYEVKTFWFETIKRGVRSYKPDFEVTNNDGTIEYHEVKGWDHPRGKTARKRMKKYHPTVKLVLVDQKSYKSIAKTVSTLLPHWERQKGSTW